MKPNLIYAQVHRGPNNTDSMLTGVLLASSYERPTANTDYHLATSLA